MRKADKWLSECNDNISHVDTLKAPWHIISIKIWLTLTLWFLKPDDPATEWRGLLTAPPGGPDGILEGCFASFSFPVGMTDCCWTGSVSETFERLAFTVTGVDTFAVSTEEDVCVVVLFGVEVALLPSRCRNSVTTVICTNKYLPYRSYY